MASSTASASRKTASSTSASSPPAKGPSRLDTALSQASKLVRLLNHGYADLVLEPFQDALRRELRMHYRSPESADKIRWQFIDTPSGAVEVRSTNGFVVCVLPNQAAKQQCYSYYVGLLRMYR